MAYAQYTYGNVRSLAYEFANDPTNACPTATADLFFKEIWNRYEFHILRERVKQLGKINAVKLPNHGYITPTDLTGVISIDSLEYSAGAAGVFTTTNPAGPVEKDDFYSVVADSELATATQNAPLRWGVLKLQGDQTFRIAVYPPSDGSYDLYAWGRAETEIPVAGFGTGTFLDCNDVDSVNMARMLAAAIMKANGEDPQDISDVVSLIDPTIREKLGYMLERAPRETQTKEAL